MKNSWRQKIATLATVAISTIGAWNPSTAATFGQQEVTQNKFIAVAAPFGERSHQLLIIEQKSSQRPCWSESGSEPVIVEPLLLDFDFSGICGRSTDSNGYSIRREGIDLGIQYLLRVVKRNNELLLIGSNIKNRQEPEIILGRTNGLADGFLKIELEPEWRFTKRTLDGRTLGHIYLTFGDSAFTFVDIASDIYADEIQQAVKLGFIAGFKEDNTFRPEATLTREQLVSMVLEGLSQLPTANFTLPTQASGKPYPDVDASRWSAAKIQWARENNIVSGYEDGTFKPTKPVTRAELMAVQRRAAEFAQTIEGKQAVLVSDQPARNFSDIQSHWAASVITEMSSYCQVASPFNETGSAFLPNNQARRNYAAAATLRMLNCVNSEVSSSN
ncbi:MAG: DUF3747 domain-containing protein [Symploca sp. SIO2E9]|nr:DUF3747 domain-containing protein [Symploca sp. SIO2E9]